MTTRTGKKLFFPNFPLADGEVLRGTSPRPHVDHARPETVQKKAGLEAAFDLKTRRIWSGFV